MKLTHTQLAALRALGSFGSILYTRKWTLRGRYHVTSAGWEIFWEQDIPGGFRSVQALVAKGLVSEVVDVIKVFDKPWSVPRWSKRTFAAGDGEEEEYTFTVTALGARVLADLKHETLPRKFGWLAKGE